MELTHPTLLPVSPSDCALAVAIPLTLDRFLADLDRLAEKDFARHFKAECQRNKLIDERCLERYDQLAQFVEFVCQDAAGQGVTVIHDALPGDVTRLAWQ